jgi:hypothetical protein
MLQQRAASRNVRRGLLHLLPTSCKSSVSCDREIERPVASVFRIVRPRTFLTV